MKLYTCKYINFNCGMCVIDEYEQLVKRFKKEFSYYYDISSTDTILSCNARIYIVDDAYIMPSESGKMSSIHSSHSKKIKYLLNGREWSQSDAYIEAEIWHKEENVLYYIAKYDAKVLVDIEKKNVYLSGRDLYDIFLYIYESLLCNYIESRGGIQLHASCCEYDGKGYIFTGKSGAGKTTLLFNIVNSGGLFHSNDRVVIFEEDGMIVAYSIPIPVNVPIELLRNNEKWENHNTIKNCSGDVKIRFLVSELGELFPQRIKKVQITQVIVVDYLSNCSNTIVQEVEDIFEDIDILTPIDENHPKWLPIFDIPSENIVNNRMEQIGKRIKIRKISGKDIFDTFKYGANE